MAKEKKPKEKKVKLKKGKGAEVGEQTEGGGKGKGKGKLKLLLLLGSVVLILAAAAIVVFTIVLPRLSQGEDSPPEESTEPEPVYYELPETFEIGAESVPALTPVEAANVQAVESVRICYTYIDLTDAGAEAEAYVKLLRESGFRVVDEQFVRCDGPDYTEPAGEVLLAKNMEPQAQTQPAENGEPAETAPPVDMVVTMRLTWSPGQCVVVGDQAEGKVTSPPQEESPIGGGSIGMQEALDYLQGLNPADLGLSGDSMESYRIYATDGTVMVDGNACMRVEIYDRSGADGTNEFAGTYLMSADGLHLYRLDETAGTVTELEMPQQG